MKKKIIALLSSVIAIAGGVIFHHNKKKKDEIIEVEHSLERRVTFYEKHIKRIVDIVCASMALLVFGWLYLLVALLVRVKLGSPVIFKQPRPGKDEKVFNLYKFRTMTDEKDEEGHYIRQERYVGNMTRSFYLGDIPKEDIKAKYEGGVLRLSVPKSDMKQIENTSTIMIE